MFLGLILLLYIKIKLCVCVDFVPKHCMYRLNYTLGSTQMLQCFFLLLLTVFDCLKHKWCFQRIKLQLPTLS
jgi:hypothetical protein